MEEQTMERRLAQRARTDFPVQTRDGRLESRCRGIELSSTGILLERGRQVRASDHTVLMNLELRLPERSKPIRALARSVWSFGTQQALKFVRINDADRLSLAEHIDLASLRGALT